jgi:hypothetical protein
MMDKAEMSSGGAFVNVIATGVTTLLRRKRSRLSTKRGAPRNVTDYGDDHVAPCGFELRPNNMAALRWAFEDAGVEFIERRKKAGARLKDLMRFNGHQTEPCEPLRLLGWLEPGQDELPLLIRIPLNWFAHRYDNAILHARCQGSPSGHYEFVFATMKD